MRSLLDRARCTSASLRPAATGRSSVDAQDLGAPGAGAGINKETTTMTATNSQTLDPQNPTDLVFWDPSGSRFNSAAGWNR